MGQTLWFGSIGGQQGRAGAALTQPPGVLCSAQVLFELDRVPRKVAVEAIRTVQAKMPIKVGFLEWN